MTMTRKIKISRDGKKTRVIITQIQQGVPAIQLAGSQYRFNAETIFDQFFDLTIGDATITIDGSLEQLAFNLHQQLQK